MTLQMPLENLSLEELRELRVQRNQEANNLKKTEEQVRNRRIEAEAQAFLIEREIAHRT